MLYDIELKIKSLTQDLVKLNNKLTDYKQILSESLINSEGNKVVERVKTNIKDLENEINDLKKKRSEKLQKLGVKLVTRGSNTSCDGEGKRDYWIFSLDTTEESIKAYLNELCIDLCGTIDSVYAYSYSPTGKWFSHPVSIIKHSDKIIAMQSWALDV